MSACFLFKPDPTTTVTTRLTLLFACLALTLPVPLPAEPHAFGEFEISVVADTSAILSTRDYQILVLQEGLLLTRLTAPHPGALSKTFVADLDGNGSFEVIVTFSDTDGATDSLHLYTWNEYRLERHTVAQLDPEQHAGYRGNDEFALVNGQLVRFYQVYVREGEHWVASADSRRLRYAYADGSWQPAQ